MKKYQKTAVTAVFILFAIIALSAVSSLNPAYADALDWKACVPPKEIVDKQPGESFNVSITFKNEGGTEDSWEINIAFEGEHWTWEGQSQTLTLKPCHKQTLQWMGNVPENAAAHSISRLVVYYDSEFTPLDWWIQITPEAELSILESQVS